MYIYTVAQVTRYVKELFETDSFLGSLWVEGEVSNLVRSTAGHLYFTLKDGNSQVRCVMFRGQIAAGNAFIPSNGSAVIVHGRLSVYEVQGTYQLYVDLIQPEGVGVLHLQYEELRARLEREGLFDEARKRPLPRFPQRIGVVTSLTGAVIHDIINVISRRFPSVELVISPGAVQGQEAADDVCQAIQALNSIGAIGAVGWPGEPEAIDIIIVARGGGSLEELWPFNEEKVARAIFGSRVPVITGIGHETDFTIADLVADCRAPTPSAAAELVVPSQQEYLSQVQSLARSMRQAMQSELQVRRGTLDQSIALMQRLSPQRLVEANRQHLDDLARQVATQARHALDLKQAELNSSMRQLDALNPVSILARGYSICIHEETGQVVKSTTQVTVDDTLQIRVHDGNLRGKVLKT